MKKNAGFVIVSCIILFASACARKLVLTQPCTPETIRMDLLKQSKRVLLDTSVTDIRIHDMDTIYRVYFLVKEKYNNMGMRGGGGIIEISKKDCKVLSEVYY
jgi:hypothetical protein